MHIKKGTIHIGSNWSPKKVIGNKRSLMLDGVDNYLRFSQSANYNTGSFQTSTTFSFSLLFFIFILLYM